MIKEIIKNSLKNSFTYEQYTTHLKQILQEPNTPDYQYILLNTQRIKRLDKTLKITLETQHRIEKIQQKMTWIAITEPWCGDASQIVPVWNKMAQLNPNIELKLVLRDKNLPLMDLFLTSGARAIPILVIIDNALNVLAHWGARPLKANQIVNQCKSLYGKVTDQCKEEVQKWYNKDKGQSTIDEVLSILESL